MQIIHPVFGISRPDGEYPRHCSKCAREIPEGDVPLMLWTQSCELMWVICGNCDTDVYQSVDAPVDMP